jgi:hypothetical protein
MAKSGSFKTASAFKGIEEAQQIGGHTLSHGVTYGIITEDNPLHIKTANCPYISEISGDTSIEQALPVLSPVYMFNDKVSEEEVRAIWLKRHGVSARSAHEVDEGM